ncbi:MAG: TatD DNase family protein [Candidatus Azotimanducaceae bacterium]|jgi:TatD DNase family protein
MSLFDIGANLTHESFKTDLSEVLEAAAHQGVHQLMVTGASVNGSEQALALAKRYPDKLFATAGIHPHHAEEATSDGMRRIEQLLSAPEVKAVGETGLDFFRDFSDRDDQAHSFISHIELAKKLELPMFLHERDAHPTFHDLLAPHRAQLDAIVVHCFTGSEAALDAYLDLDCYIGITGWICDERRGQHLKELVSRIPLDRIMIETDSPYLMPRTLKPKPKSRRNEPKHLAHICDFIANILGLDATALAAITTENAKTFFKL